MSNNEQKKDPEDGSTVINIYSRGVTELGRLLSNFSQQKILLPEGEFYSIEAYWYYLCISSKCPERDEVKEMHGNQAKSFGDDCKRRYPRDENEIEEDFENKIKEALTIKVKNNIRIMNLMKASTLPFDHYYWHGKKQKLTRYNWIVQHFEEIRTKIKLGTF